ncbi:DUF2894 domain-containing protein [Isoalcanivorax indicus]|uniref:DUF2894 domain-containing protein n=1 Tax=Isoalcanivorax indicus TaxID=2202653 RepID=UPI000DB90B1D|nr:DUF2894 domain-containing protein [Isoalcanivorax indicus]
MTEGDMQTFSDALRQLGEQDAAVHDPIRYAWLRSLHTRLERLPRVPARLGQRLEAGLEQCQDTVARRHAADQMSRPEKPSPLGSLLAQLSPPDVPQAEDTSLAELLRQQARQFLPDAQPPSAAQPSGLRHLASLREARALQQRRQRLHDMIRQAPHDAGPLNSHRIVARALNTLQQSTPAYLDHLLNYLDTLSALEQMR